MSSGSNDNRYLLRLWCEGADGNDWRATLRELSSDATWHFATIGQLVGHLAELTGSDGEEERSD